MYQAWSSFMDKLIMLMSLTPGIIFSQMDRLNVQTKNQLLSENLLRKSQNPPENPAGWKAN